MVTVTVSNGLPKFVPKTIRPLDKQVRPDMKVTHNLVPSTYLTGIGLDLLLKNEPKPISPPVAEPRMAARYGSFCMNSQIAILHGAFNSSSSSMPIYALQH